jgi:hypothetical protein
MLEMRLRPKTRMNCTELGLMNPVRSLQAIWVLAGNDFPTFEIGTERTNANLLLRIAKLLDVRLDYFCRGYIKVNMKVL